jgi:hypothetical protein
LIEPDSNKVDFYKQEKDQNKNIIKEKSFENDCKKVLLDYQEESSEDFDDFYLLIDPPVCNQRIQLYQWLKKNHVFY